MNICVQYNIKEVENKTVRLWFADSIDVSIFINSVCIRSFFISDGKVQMTKYADVETMCLVFHDVLQKSIKFHTRCQLLNLETFVTMSTTNQ